MNTVNKFTTIYLKLNLRDMLEVVILLITHLIMYAFQIKQKI